LSIGRITKKANVESVDEKIETFFDLYKNKINIDIRLFFKILNDYREYVDWSERYFSVSSYFCYEQHIPEIEKFILDLPIFQHQSKKITWKEKFGIDFNDWNRLHHLKSDIGSLELENILETEKFVNNQKSELTHQFDINSRSNLSIEIKEKFTGMQNEEDRNMGIIPYLTSDKKLYAKKIKNNYEKSNSAIEKMVELGIIMSPLPIKKQSLAEKMHMVKNFDQCLRIYNDWIKKNQNLGSTISQQDLLNQIEKENKFWKTFTIPDNSSVDHQPNKNLSYHDDEHL
jgi:hypothetical protein